MIRNRELSIILEVDVTCALVPYAGSVLYSKEQNVSRLQISCHGHTVEDILRHSVSKPEIWDRDWAQSVSEACCYGMHFLPVHWGECAAFVRQARPLDKCARMFWQARRNEIRSSLRPPPSSASPYRGIYSHRVLCWLQNLCKPDNAWLVHGATLRALFSHLPLATPYPLSSIQKWHYSFGVAQLDRVYSFWHSALLSHSENVLWLFV